MWKKTVAIKQHKYTDMIPGEKVASMFLLEGCKLCNRLRKCGSPRRFSWQLSARVSHTFQPSSVTWLQLLRSQTITGTDYITGTSAALTRNILVDLCAPDFAHSPALWRQPPFTNVTCAWIMRLYGINLPVLNFGKWHNSPLHDSFQHTNKSLLLLVERQTTNKPRKSAAWSILPYNSL